MPFESLQGFDFSDIPDPDVFAEAKTMLLREIYAGRERRIVSRLNAGKSLTEAGRARAEALIRQIHEEIDALDVEAAKWAKDAGVSCCELGMETSQAVVRKYGIAGDLAAGSTPHTQAVSAIVEQMAADLLTANATMRATTERFIHLTQQKAVDDAALSRIVAEGLVTGDARRTVSARMLAEIEDRIGAGQLIQAGGRHFDPGYYAELVARTRTREAATQGAVNGAQALGMDLMQVSVHSHPNLDSCSPYQGRVFSISGANGDFPKLDRRPPFHPNCRHVLIPVSDMALRERGQYDAVRTLSNQDYPADATALKNWKGKKIDTLNGYQRAIKRK